MADMREWDNKRLYEWMDTCTETITEDKVEIYLALDDNCEKKPSESPDDWFLITCPEKQICW